MRKSPIKAQKARSALASYSMKGFSAGEKDLYRNVRAIKDKREAEKRAELARTQAYF